MLVWTTRTLPLLAMRALFYGALFIIVVVTHLGLTSALRERGLNGSISLLASGAVVLALVLIVVNVADWVRERLAARREVQRMTQRLPGGPCCVVWRAPDAPPEPQNDEDMPWELATPMRARYPRLARRLGVEGVAIAEFEVTTEGRAKNIACVDAWPSDVFYEAAREALAHARFQPKPDIHVRYGASYRMPFVFRISGAAKLKDQGQKARRLYPTLHRAAEAVEKLRSSA
ncbi:MAG: energy transducer TonB [Hyphomonadaceae bacterium]